MWLTKKERYIAAAILAAALVAAFVAAMLLHAYVSRATDLAKADQIKQDVQQQIGDLQKSLAASLAAIAKDKAEAKTPQQIAAMVPKYTPEVHPVVIVPGGAPLQSSEAQSPAVAPQIALPDAPSAIQAGSLVIPADQVPAYWRSVTACAEDRARLAACGKELPLATRRAESAEQALKGGSIWTRFKRNAKWFAIGAAAGVVAGAVAAR